MNRSPQPTQLAASQGERSHKPSYRIGTLFRRTAALRPLEDRGPLRAWFLTTSMPVGGAETLLLNLVQRLDRSLIQPEIGCLKQLGPLGETLANQVPASCQFLSGKYDARVLYRLARHCRRRQIDALITVGAGDKMFWGRLAARCAAVPVVCCALHSTGWPDGIGRLNRLLTPITDAFIAVAHRHAAYLKEHERLPSDKVAVIPNGIDTLRFCRSQSARDEVRRALGVAGCEPLVGTVAALRPEKRHDRLLEVAKSVLQTHSNARFLVVGDGPCRGELERLAGSLGIARQVHFVGSRQDIPQLLSAMDVFLLTSDNEANPVSVLEALACEVPVVAPRVGSVPETVRPGETGLLAEPQDVEGLARGVRQLLADPEQAAVMARAGRQLVADHWSLERMVHGYERLLVELYRQKCRPDSAGRPLPAARPRRAEVVESG